MKAEALFPNPKRCDVWNSKISVRKDLPKNVLAILDKYKVFEGKTQK